MSAEATTVDLNLMPQRPSKEVAKEHVTGPFAAPRGEVKRRPGADLYDAILWRIARSLELDGGAAPIHAMIGTGRGCGTSTIAANIAIRAADHGFGPVCLVDCNLERPCLGSRFRLATRPGVSELLAGLSQVEETLQSSAVEGLSLIAAGDNRLLKGRGVHMPVVRDLMTDLRERFALVLVDLPSLGELHAVIPVAQACDSATLLVRDNALNDRQLQSLLHTAEVDGLRITGTVLTRHRSSVPSWLRRSR